MTTTVHLVLLETSGNQAYLFATNRLRENVGASQLTYLAGTRFVLEAIAQVTGGCIALWHEDAGTLRGQLAAPWKIESGAPAEVITATSGKALLLVDTAERGRDIVDLATRQALKEAPGLDLCGVVSEPFQWDSQQPIQDSCCKQLDPDFIHEQIKRVHKQFEHIRGDRLQPATRFARLPVVAECGTSGLPAYALDARRGELLARTSVAKQDHHRAWFRRIAALLKPHRLWAERSIDDLEEHFENLNWLALIHADGNGLGKIFLEFDRYLSLPPTCQNANRAYVEALRAFSLALEKATEQAFLEALKDLPTRENKGRKSTRTYLPLIPLVLGGDDLTALCDGRYALAFTQRYLQAFEQSTQQAEAIAQVTRQAFAGCPRLAACAGIAMIKPHFPFHSGYELAESLLRSAKAVKRYVTHETATGRAEPYPCSALDFHLLYDASFRDLDSIRERLTLERETTRLYARPYVVTSVGELTAVTADGKAWAEARHIDGLIRRIKIMQNRTDGRRSLPNSQLHALREGLFLGRRNADDRLKLILARYREQGLAELLELQQPPSLFRPAPAAEQARERKAAALWETRFKDALDLVGLWPEQQL